MILHRTSLTTVRTVLEARQQRGPCAGGDQPRGCKLGEQGRGGGRVIRCLTDLGRSAPQPASPAQSRASASRAVPVHQPVSRTCQKAFTPYWALPGTVCATGAVPTLGSAQITRVSAYLGFRDRNGASERSAALCQDRRDERGHGLGLRVGTLHQARLYAVRLEYKPQP